MVDSSIMSYQNWELVVLDALVNPRRVPFGDQADFHIPVAHYPEERGSKPVLIKGMRAMRFATQRSIEFGPQCDKLDTLAATR